MTHLRHLRYYVVGLFAGGTAIGALISSPLAAVLTSALAGECVFTTLTGWLVDHFSYSPVFYLAGAIPLLGFTLLHYMGLRGFVWVEDGISG